MKDLRDWASLAAEVARLQKAGKKVVFTNGCFDIIHRGHVAYLTDAKALGDFLIVGLNADASVRRLKGPTRPVNAEGDRAFVMAGLKPVDAVCLFDDDTPLTLIQTLNPDVLVKGGDWTPDSIVGADHVLAKGGIVKSLPFHDGYSTTCMIARAKS